VGAKSYYFGCGGSTKQFKDFIKQEEGDKVTIETVRDLADGIDQVLSILEWTLDNTTTKFHVLQLFLLLFC